MENRKPLLEVRNLKQHFKVSRKFSVKAVDGVSFEIYPGEKESLGGKVEIEKNKVKIKMSWS